MSYRHGPEGLRMEAPSRPADAGSTRSVWEGAPFLAADIGGTHARLALVQRRPDDTIAVLDSETYPCADFGSLAEIVSGFLSRPGCDAVNDAAIGCAGMRRDDMVISINLPWPVSLSELRGLGIARVHAVNDFVAVAHAVQCMGPESSVLLCGPEAAMEGPSLVIGPGTGLGAAFRIRAGAHTIVLPSEAGQTAFAPGTPRELAVLAKMMERRPHVSVEQIVSGPGLLKLYRALCELDGVAASCATPAAVADAARAGEAQALEAAITFCDVLGSLLGDLVMVGGATSVYIAGGMLPRMRDFIDRSGFHARFTNKGVLRALLEQVPVRLIDHPHKGVIGAADWYLAQVGDS